MIFRPVFTAAFRNIVFTPPQGEIPNPLPPFFQHLFSTSKLLAENVNGSAVYDTSPLAGDRRAIHTGLSRDFDGADDIMSFSNIALSGDFTIEYWGNPDALSGNGYSILFSHSSQNVQILSLLANGSVGFYLASGTLLASSETGLYTFGEWSHFALCRTLGVLKLYVDGVQLSGSAVSNEIVNINVFGSWNGGASYAFNGKAYGIRFSSVARYSADFDVMPIKNTYEYDDDTIAIWYMSESTGTTCYDAATGTYNGTYTNGPANYPLSDGYGADNLNQFGYTDSSGVLIPRKESAPTTDASGGSLQYTGRVTYDGLLKASACVAFDGADDEILVSSTFGISKTSVSVLLWVNIINAPDNGAFIKIGGSSSGFGIGVGNGTFDAPGNNLVAIFETFRWIDSATAIGTGWHHVGIVLDASGFPHLFLNGTEVYSDSAGDSVIAAGNETHIGGYTNVFARFANIEISDVRIFNSALSESDVLAVKNNTSTIAPIAHFMLSEGNGLTVYDRIGSITGTLTNGPTWATQDVYHGNLQNGFDLWTADAGGAELRVSLLDDDTSIKGTGDTITGYTWQSKRVAGNYFIPAETQIDFTGGVASVASIAYSWETDYSYNDDRFPCNFKTQSSGTEYNFVSYPCTTETFLYSMGFSAWQNSQYLALL